jgi:2-polyprenyl-6-methoxyphenol hydroxylase-like FAD-dependent oxidoreductase
MHFPTGGVGLNAGIQDAMNLGWKLAEIREPDLRFSLAEARELFDAAGVELAEPTLELLLERTEGWAAGLRHGQAGKPPPRDRQPRRPFLKPRKELD